MNFFLQKKNLPAWAVEMSRAQKFSLFVMNEHQNVGRLPVTVFQYLIKFQSHNFLKKSNTENFVKSSLGH